MLLLGRREGQGVYIGRGIKVTVVEVKDDGTVRLGIEAPKFVAVSRDDFPMESHLRQQERREREATERGDGRSP